MSKNKGLRLLYASKNLASRQARKILRDAKVKFFQFSVPNRLVDTREDPKPPCLITGEGRFSGVKKIKCYVDGLKERL